MSRLPGINADLADAIRRVNSAYFAIPTQHRPAPAPFEALELEIERARATGDRDRARVAIAAWRDHHLSRLTSVLASCPLEADRG